MNSLTECLHDLMSAIAKSDAATPAQRDRARFILRDIERKATRNIALLDFRASALPPIWECDSEGGEHD